MNARAAAGATGQPSIEVVIPTWNRRDLLRESLASLGDQETDVGICVVDNGSGDDTAAMVRDEFPQVRLVPLERNLGFGAAVNHGVRTSDADLIALINNDARADRSFVSELRKAHAITGAGMVAGCMVDAAGVVESAGVVADQSLIPYDHLHGERYADVVASDVEPPLGPSGGAALYDRAVMLAAGGFDEEIFAYLEDLDLALRLRLAGVRCAVAPRAYVTHAHSATLGSGSPAKNRLMTRNRRYILWKYERSLGLGPRVRGALIDLVVAAGRVAIDRNASAVGGWAEARRTYPRSARPAPGPGLSAVPLQRLSTGRALRRRLARRR